MRLENGSSRCESSKAKHSIAATNIIVKLLVLLTLSRDRKAHLNVVDNLIKMILLNY